MEERYELRKNPREQWEVAHYWSDGVTIQVCYFTSFKEAEKYFKMKVSNNDSC